MVDSRVKQLRDLLDDAIANGDDDQIEIIQQELFTINPNYVKEFNEGGFAKGSARTSLAGMEIGLPLADILDFESERARLIKEMKVCDTEAVKLRGKLSNKGFLEKAPPTVIYENKRRLSEEEIKIKGLEAALGRLDADV